jgi:hypothetical protein
LNGNADQALLIPHRIRNGRNSAVKESSLWSHIPAVLGVQHFVPCGVFTDPLYRLPDTPVEEAEQKF